MTVDEICALPVAKLGAEQSVLFLWTINRYIEQSYAVARAWGYKPNTMLTWIKAPIGGGMGGCFGFTTEFLLFATRGPIGRMGLEIARERYPSTWFESKRGPHSRKPLMAREIIDRMFDGPKIELFAREAFLGWDAWGDEIISDMDLHNAERNGPPESKT